MKKIICILSAIAVIVSLAIVSSAKEINSVYASKSIQNDIQTNMYDVSSSYNFLFGTNNIKFDFSSAIPVYQVGEYNQENDYRFFSDIITFSERYAVPVYNSSSNEFLGFAKFGKIVPYDELPQILKDHDYTANLSLNHAGEWELKSFTSDNYYENLLYQIENNKNPANKVYYVWTDMDYFMFLIMRTVK